MRQAGLLHCYIRGPAGGRTRLGRTQIEYWPSGWVPLHQTSTNEVDSTEPVHRCAVVPDVWPGGLREALTVTRISIMADLYIDMQIVTMTAVYIDMHGSHS